MARRAAKAEGEASVALQQLLFWHWWVIAGGLVILELRMPRFFFLWLAFSSTAVGFLPLFFPGLSASFQLAAFSFLSLTTGLAWYRRGF